VQSHKKLRIFEALSALLKCTESNPRPGLCYQFCGWSSQRSVGAPDSKAVRRKAEMNGVGNGCSRKKETYVHTHNVSCCRCGFRLRNDLYCVGCGVKLHSLTPSWLLLFHYCLSFPYRVANRLRKYESEE